MRVPPVSLRRPATSTPAWWLLPLAATAATAILGLAALRPWQTPTPPSARATWVVLQQVTMVTLIVLAWLTPRLTGLRHGLAARAAAVGIALQLLTSLWNNQLGGSYERFGTLLDSAIRAALTAGTGVALVILFGSITRRRVRSTGSDQTAIVDAGVISTAVGVLVWESLVVHLGATQWAVATAAIATAVVIAATALFARLLLLSSTRTMPAVRLMGAALLLGMVVVVRFALDGMAGDPTRNHWWELSLLLAFGTMVAAILHPSMRMLVDDGEPETLPSEGTVRAVILCLAVVVPAAVTLIRVTTAVWGASAGDWQTMLSVPPAVAGVVITSGVAWRLATLVREREETHRLLRHRSLHDDLTGLPNRAYLLERLEQRIASVRAQPRDGGAGFGLMFLDLDDFKSINDTYGHHAGDAVLVDVAHRLADTVRTDDFVGRMAGDEFVLLCGRPSDAPSLHQLAERLRAAVEAPMPAEFGVVTPRISVGIVAVDHEAASARDAVNTILRRADAQMYEAKRTARRPPAPTDTLQSSSQEPAGPA
ncbi:MAG: GGDEF domain-containing protein [Actinobacteria bacterium]|nr:GGDEF domain-containing protein [Actinomycetota bacterium]